MVQIRKEKEVNRNIWMAVTPDSYELPVLVADTAKELAQMMGVSKNTVKSSEVKYRLGQYKKGNKYKIVCVRGI